jgi:HAE1 family hydrophobic/amphiphilic exporter-1
MKIIDVAIRRPTSIVVVVLLVVIFGVLSLSRMPIQMRPTIDRPQISVQVNYPGVAPPEIELQVTTPIEQRLNTVQNLTRITSRSQTGSSHVSLEFEWGVNKDLAGLDVLKKLNQVRNLPEDAESPIITAAKSDDRAISYIAVRSSTLGVNTLFEITEDMIAPMIERLEGVGRVQIYGGRKREIQVILDYEAMTSRGISIAQIRTAIGNENRNARGGYIDEGKRRVMVRTLGQFERLSDLENVIVDQRPTGPVYLRDIARIDDSFEELRTTVRESGQPAVVMAIVKRSGANTIQVMEGVDGVLEGLREEMAVKDIVIVKAIDESDYIWDSINQVVSNLQIGGVLACVILLLFLRNFVSTAIISFAIPVSLVATFIFLYSAGSSLNIITLAGLAFAVGMVVDNAIVVLENIYRHAEMGVKKERAAFMGAEEVWGAVLASTLTTLAVFLPIIFVKEEVGQLFRDIALSISFAIVMSLVVSITLIPMLASKWLGGVKKREGQHHRVLDALTFTWLGGFVNRFFLGSVRWLLKGVGRKIVFVLVVLGLFGGSLSLLPPAEYLPIGSMNTIRGGMRLPPGSNVDQANYLMRQVEQRFMAIEERKNLFVISGLFNLVFLVCKDEYKSNLQPVIAKMRNLVKDIPGVRIGISQMGIFSRSSGGKTVELQVRGKDLDEIQKHVTVLEEKLNGIEGVLDASTSLDIRNPEYRIQIDRERAAQLGLSVRAVAETVETLVGGKSVSLYRSGGDEVAITLRGNPEAFHDVENIREILVYTPSGTPVRLGSLIQINEGLGPTQIQHLNMDRVISLTIRFEEDVPLEVMLGRIKSGAVNPMLAAMPLGYTIEMGETADNLARTKTALGSAFLLAVVIIYLLMASLFESFRYPLIILVSVPLAMTGAILGIIVTGSEFNVITMLGFIILSGIVVNNAILLIHQALRAQREGGAHYNDAVISSCQMRMRPIFMSTMTSVLGMLPLALGTGAGSELYSGLGAAIVGGLLVSTLFTLILVPVLFSLFNDFGQRMRRMLGREEASFAVPLSQTGSD